jgi:hypothetical protein
MLFWANMNLGCLRFMSRCVLGPWLCSYCVDEIKFAAAGCSFLHCVRLLTPRAELRLLVLQ